MSRAATRFRHQVTSSLVLRPWACRCYGNLTEIAFKVKKTRKPVVLEPMNPYERRIIHASLQGNRYVETVSEGEEPYRHVVVKLKRNNY